MIDVPWPWLWIPVLKWGVGGGIILFYLGALAEELAPSIGGILKYGGALRTGRTAGTPSSARLRRFTPLLQGRASQGHPPQEARTTNVGILTQNG